MSTTVFDKISSIPAYCRSASPDHDELNIETEMSNAIDNEIRRRFYDEHGRGRRFNFRAFKDFLLAEVRECVEVIMRSKRGEWGLEQNTTNKEFEEEKLKCKTPTDCGRRRYCPG